MATARRRSEKPTAVRGWLGTAAGLVFLIVVGFALGMTAGIVWEEPDLMLAYLSGDTEEVTWTAGAGDAAVAASRPADPQVRRERDRELSDQPDVPAVAAGPVGGLVVQVGAFGTSEAAELLAKSLREKGFPVYISPGTKAGESRWRVRVGPLATREEAEAAAEQLKRTEKLPTWIQSEDAG